MATIAEQVWRVRRLGLTFILAERKRAAPSAARRSKSAPVEFLHTMETNLMPTLSRSLEQSLHRALALANERHHEYVTLEYLLLALVDDEDAAAVACNVDIDKLRRNLVTYVESELEKLATDGSEDSKPTAGLQRTIQHAVIHVQSSGHEEVTGANVLVAWPGPYATSKISSTTFNNAASP